MKTKLSCIILKIAFLFLPMLSGNYVNGQTPTRQNVNSPPPPPNYQPPPEQKSTSGNWIYVDDNRNSIPAYLWSYGCVNTSAAMLAAYYDRNGYTCVYRGSINGGLAPPNNNSWPTANLPVPGDANSYYPNCKNSISASINGFDGRTINGNIDDFWVEYTKDKNDPHPWVNGAPPHDFTVSPCMADYLGTSQDYFNNPDGNTSIYKNEDGSKLYDYSACENLPGTSRGRDITHGLKLFFEEGIGYSVTNVYTQLIYGLNGNQQGFTMPDFINEIDQGRPVLVNFEGHTAIGIGYNAAENKIALYDTWSTTKDKIVWGAAIIDGHGDPHCMVSVTVLELLDNLQKSGKEELSCSGAVGPFDYVTIKDPPANTPGPPDGSIMPPNTYEFAPGSALSMYAEFTSYYGDTYPTQWDWKLELYTTSGSYVYAQYNVPTWSNPWRWVTTVSNSLPAYDWIFENGKISGKVTVTVHISDGDTKSDEVRVGVICAKNLQNITYTTSQTITGCKISATNVSIQNKSNVIFDADEININGPFEVQMGSTFETK